MPTVRTEPTHTAPAPVDTAQPADRQDNTSDLADNQVKLSDGRIVTIKETSAKDDDDYEMLLGRMGYSPQHGMDFMRYQRGKAIMAIESIDGEKAKLIRTKDELKAALYGFRSPDMNRIMKAYSEVNGLGGADDDSFPE